mmetsp:Transcript_13476/g.40773  ORF Transcript_13476/g.40773 Transcript_13476/m.40773 type:complete len:197 (-) Transcript_13476:872-1462(-)
MADIYFHQPSYFTPPRNVAPLPPPPLSVPHGPPGGVASTSQIHCLGCTSTLMYASGASAVRCARCGHVTHTHAAQQQPPAVSGGQSQLVCSNYNCRTLLQYPAGALQVQCSVCNTVSCATPAAAVSHIQCSQCQVTLRYPSGASSVRCAVCGRVTSAHSRTALPPPSQPTQSHLPPTQTVVVENPGDDIAIGIARA